MAPRFSDHEAAEEYIHMVCTTGLAALAYLWMFSKKSGAQRCRRWRLSEFPVRPDNPWSASLMHP